MSHVHRQFRHAACSVADMFTTLSAYYGSEYVNKDIRDVSCGAERGAGRGVWSAGRGTPTHSADDIADTASAFIMRIRKQLN